jgi:Asp-tRNA(Asn)/Glu-tRNA(Gln) amidotransferase A subunit family amidase
LVSFEQQLELLENAGYTIKRVATLGDIQAINLRHQQLTNAEMAQVHKTWFADYASLYRPRTAENIRVGQTVSAKQVAQASAGRALLRLELEAFMKQEEIDLWVCPAAVGPAPEGIAKTGDTVMNLPWTHAGMPTLTLPAGKAANGLPLGLQVIGPAMADEQLLTWAGPMADALARMRQN